jgi:hypothetical protein
MRMITWRSSTIQILSTKRLDDESYSKLNSSSDDQFRIELDLHAMTSNRDHHFDHHCDHHLKSEHNQQTWRQDDWVDDVETMRRRWDQIIVLEDESWLMTIILSRWVDHFELKKRLPRLNESKDDYIERPKFPHLVDRQRKKFSLYQSIKLDSTFSFFFWKRSFLMHTNCEICFILIRKWLIWNFNFKSSRIFLHLLIKLEKRMSLCQWSRQLRKNHHLLVDESTWTSCSIAFSAKYNFSSFASVKHSSK